MIITCTSCSMRLQVEDEKVPARPFTLRCPKCQSIVHAQPVTGTYEESALARGNSPASGNPRLESPAPAPPYKLDASADKKSEGNGVDESSSADSKDLLRMLATLLQRGTQTADNARPWRRSVLVCVGEMHREAVAHALADNIYDVYVAENKAQAVERMRDERMDVLVLSPDFDVAEQGEAFIRREINSLRPPERRRLFLVQLTDAGRTQDAHAAFIGNVSLIVNTEDIEKMGRALERSLRDYNELYRSFNEVLKVSPI